MPPKGKGKGGGPTTGLTVFVLNMWTKKGFWGTIGVYIGKEECRNDAGLLMETMPIWTHYRMEVVEFMPKT